MQKMCLQNVSCEMVIYIVKCHEIASECGTYITSNSFIRTNHTNCTQNWVCSPWKRALSCYEILQFTRNYITSKFFFFWPFNNSYFDWGGIMFIIRSFSRNANLDLCSMYKYSIVHYWKFYAYRCQTTVVAPLRSKVETITQDIILNQNLCHVLVT